jgi:hypothetical protein
MNIFNVMLDILLMLGGIALGIPIGMWLTELDRKEKSK